MFQLQTAEVQPVSGRVRGLRKADYRAQPGLVGRVALLHHRGTLEHFCRIHDI